MNISIDTSRCIRCGHCVLVCPSRLFAFSVDRSVGLITSEGCIGCGHCVSACEAQAVVHSEFSADKVHTIDRQRLPRPDQVMELIASRRSNRAFSKQEVPAEMLDMIVRAAYLAPTASNLQGLEFTVITDPAKLRIISEFTVETFNSIYKKVGNPLVKPLLKRFAPSVYRYIPMFERLLDSYQMGDDLILRGARAVILIHTKKPSRFGAEDANLAYQNGSLMAESLGVSQFYTGFVLNAIRQRGKTPVLQRRLGIEGVVYASMALGMPRFKYPAYVDRKPLKVTKI